MKKSFLLLCTLLLVLGCALPLAAYHLTRAVLGPAVSTVRLPLSSPESTASAPEISAAYAGDADRFLIQDASTGQVLELSRREYLIGAVAAEMPVSWPDEALKAQAVAAHSYALYCRDHAAPDSIGWLTADPARRQGCLTDPVLRSYWGTAYETNYARLSALVDEVEHTVLLCDGAPACASYFAISNGRTEASENVWGTALPYLVSVDSSTDLSADHYEYALTLSAQQTAQQLAALGLTADLAAPEQWFGTRSTPPPVMLLPCRSAGSASPVRPCGRRWACAAPASRSGMRAVRSVLPQKATAMAWGSASGVPRHWPSRGGTLPTSWPITTPELPCPDKKEPISRRRQTL